MAIACRHHRRVRVAVLTFGLGLAGASCEAPPPVDTATDTAAAPMVTNASISIDEFSLRRAHIMRALADGILVLHARPVGKAMEQWGFVQDPSFLYFSGLPEVPGAILALDGPAGETHLFLPPAPMSFGMAVAELVPSPGAATAEQYGFSTARYWSEFEPWIAGRVAGGIPLYLDEARNAEATGVPGGMDPVAGDRTLWRHALAELVPAAALRSAKLPIMEQRSVKSEAEIAILERNARATVVSLAAVAMRLRPGVRQRETEAAMISACLGAGGQGPSFWPWTMSGPNAHVGRLVGAFFRYDQGDRAARSGELVRVDIGCAGGSYGADVGRTLPTSGRFTAGQAEAWDLLVAGYLAGLDAMRDGSPVSLVRSASMDAVRSGLAGGFVTPMGPAAGEAMLAAGEGLWHIHGVGLDSGEDLPEVLRAGMVLAYEPGFSLGDDAYYLEDMILVTQDGHRVLSTGLPYTSEDIARFMSGPNQAP